MLAGAPAGAPDVPADVRCLAGRRNLRAVWQNEAGGVTYEVGAGDHRSFVKWAPAGSGADHPAEAARLQWAVRFAPVPLPLGHGAGPDGSWLVTAALPGVSAVDDRWVAEPSVAVRALGEGLRALHESLPADRCPFSWTADDRLADARQRAAAGHLDPARWHAEHQPFDVDTALGVLSDVPPVDVLVVCHGDACAPNTLLTDDGRCCGHVDLGALGVADRWADLAVATWSAGWNYGPGWEPLLLDAYGVAADPDRIRYYRLLWDLGP